MFIGFKLEQRVLSMFSALLEFSVRMISKWRIPLLNNSLFLMLLELVDEIIRCALYLVIVIEGHFVCSEILFLTMFLFF